MTTGKKDTLVFAVFNEIGIINQLATSVFQHCMPDGLHVSHFSVLNHLVRVGDGRTPQQITAAFQVTKGTMTHTLATLSGRGFVQLRPHATDGRSKQVYLSDAGRDCHQRAIAAVSKPLRTLEAEFGSDTLNTLLPTLRMVREYLDDHRELARDDSDDPKG